MKINTLIFCILAISIFYLSCSGGMTINPQYATRSIGMVTGEVSLRDSIYPAPKFGDPQSMGGVKLESRVDYFFNESLKAELNQFGLRINPQARLEIATEIMNAETEFRMQGRDHVFSSQIAIRFLVFDKEINQVVYDKIHQGSSTQSQSTGRYPASASVVDALSQTYNRFLTDPSFSQILVQTRSINLYGADQTSNGAQVDYTTQLYRDYEEALKDMMPDVLQSLEPIRYNGVLAVFGFKNNQSKRSNLSLEVERAIHPYIAQNRFNLVTRDIDTIMQEQMIQQSDLFDENQRVEIGNLIGATHIITGSLYHYEEDNIIKLRIEILDVSSGLVMAAFTTNLVASRNYINMLHQEID